MRAALSNPSRKGGTAHAISERPCACMVPFFALSFFLSFCVLSLSLSISFSLLPLLLLPTLASVAAPVAASALVSFCCTL